MNLSMRQETELLTQTEFAAILGVDRKTVRKWARSGKLPRPIISDPPRWTVGQIRETLGTDGEQRPRLPS